MPQFKTLAEFGVVFLLFTIGVNYSLPQLHATGAEFDGWQPGADRHGEVCTRTDVMLGTNEPRVLIGGYGRVGHTIAVLLQDSGIAFMAIDTDLKRVAHKARLTAIR